MNKRATSTIFFAGAAALSALTCGVHIILGGRETIDPLLSSQDLPDNARFTLYYVWHLVSVVLGFFTLGFAFAWRNPTNTQLTWGLTLLALVAALWNLALIALFDLSPITFGQWILFSAIAVCGFLGLRKRETNANS